MKGRRGEAAEEKGDVDNDEGEAAAESSDDEQDSKNSGAGEDVSEVV
jgi:hypothetical protein